VSRYFLESVVLDVEELESELPEPDEEEPESPDPDEPESLEPEPPSFVDDELESLDPDDEGSESFLSGEREPSPFAPDRLSVL
jgi:hypothetical protein